LANTTIQKIILQGDGKAFIAENFAGKEALLTPLPLYLQDADNTDVFDYGGTIKTITLTGVFIGDTEAKVKSFIDSVEALIQGHQDTQAGAPYTFTDDRRGTLKVKVFNFDSTFVEGWPLGATWTLKLIQSSTNA
jgi:hypothetical protein